MKTIVFWIAICTILLAQDGGSRLATLSGAVTSSDGKAVAGATVRLTMDLPALLAQDSPLRSMGQSVVTNGEGRFTLERVPPGTYRVVVEADGYLRQEYGGRPATTTGTPVTVAASAEITNLNVRLTRSSVISGRVTTAAGDPAPNVPVHAVRWTYAQGARSLREQGQRGATDSRGDFQITGLAPGQYFVYAVPPAAISRPDRIERSALPTYAPNALRLSEAIPVNLAAASDGFANVRLREDQQVTVRGKVVVPGDSRDRPPAGAAVLLMQDGDTPVLQGPPATNPADRLRQQVAAAPTLPYVSIARTDADGSFTLTGVLPGLRRLVAFGGNRLWLNASAEGSVKTIGLRMNEPATPDDGSTGVLEIPVGREDVDGVTIHLSPAGEITTNFTIDGKTHDEWTRANLERLAAMVPADRMPKAIDMPAPVTLIPEGGVSYGGTPQATRNAPRTNTQTVSPGRYFVNVSGANLAFYVKSMNLNGVDITRKPLDFRGGRAELEIVAATDFGAVSGAVTGRDGTGVPRALVSLWPVARDLSRQDGGTLAAVSTDKASFMALNVAPGEYYAAAFEDLPDPGLVRYLPFLQEFTSRARRVTVGPKGTAQANLEAIPLSEIQRVLSNLR